MDTENLLDNLDRLEREAQRKARLKGFSPRLVAVNGMLIMDIVDERDFLQTEGLPPRQIGLEMAEFVLGLGCAHPTLITQCADYN